MRQQPFGRIFLSVLLATGPLVVACDDSGTGGDDDNPAVDASPGPDSGVTPDAPLAADASPADAGPTPSVTFTRHTVDMAANGPAFVSVADVDDDDRLDLVVSSFGQMAGFAIPSGEVNVFHRGATLASWTKESLIPTTANVIFPNQTTVDDVDGDGDLDVVVPSGFLVCGVIFIPGAAPCGALAWYEQTAQGWIKHTIKSGQSLFYHHVVLVDLDGDDKRDLVTTGEEQAFAGMGMTRAETQWYKGTATADRFETSSRMVGNGGGSFPRVLDVDGDGDLDIASAEFFVAGGSFAWWENDAMSFTKHAINSDSGPSIQMSFVDDLYGDGVLHAVGANHTNTAKVPPDPQESAVFVFDLPTDRGQPWTKHQISTGIVSLPGSQMAPMGAPGIFGHGDIDGDSDIDLVVSGDGDPDVYWLEQTGVGTWLTHKLDTGIEQAGGMVVIDLDGDGINEIVVTGFSDNVVYVYERN